MLSALPNQFVYNLPQDFVPGVIEDTYKPIFKKNKMLHRSVIDYLNASIRSITLPAISYPTSTQTVKYGKEVEWRSVTSIFDTPTRQLDMVVGTYDAGLNYFIYKNCLDWHYLNTNKNYISPLSVTVIDEYRNPIVEYTFRSILGVSISEIPLNYGDLRTEDKTFNIQFNYSWYDVVFYHKGINLLTMSSQRLTPSELSDDNDEDLPSSIKMNL
jgi:hypothetical protein